MHERGHKSPSRSLPLPPQRQPRLCPCLASLSVLIQQATVVSWARARKKGFPPDIKHDTMHLSAGIDVTKTAGIHGVLEVGH
jgi:hypothetical protein